MLSCINDNLRKVHSSFHKVKVIFCILSGTIIILEGQGKLGCTKIQSQLKPWAKSPELSHLGLILN